MDYTIVIVYTHIMPKIVSFLSLVYYVEKSIKHYHYFNNKITE